jgi:hypothetical protein
MKMKESYISNPKERTMPLNLRNEFREYLYDYSDNCFEKDEDKHFPHILDEVEMELDDKSKQV